MPATVAWLAEEVGELAQAVRKGNHDQQVHEFGDVIAWVATLANQMGVDLDAGRAAATPTVAPAATACPARACDDCRRTRSARRRTGGHSYWSG